MNTGPLKTLEVLRQSLRTAATMCGPSQFTHRVSEDQSFDSADLDDDDINQCVGVDERAAELESEYFLDAEEVDWHANAVWVLAPEETRTFISDALVSHLAPLYVPYAPINAKQPSDIVPDDVKEDISALADAFVNEYFENTMSVQDLKDSLSTLLGLKGLALLPNEYPLYDSFELGKFSDIFVDDDVCWEKWLSIGDENADSDEEKKSVQDEMVEALAVSDTQSVSSGTFEVEGGWVKLLSSPGKGVGDLLRGYIAETLGVVGLSAKLDECIDAVDLRLRQARGYRNAVWLLSRLAGQPLGQSHGGVAGLEELATNALLLGPLASTALARHDPPRAALAAARAFAASFAATRPELLGPEAVCDGGWRAGQALLEAMAADAPLAVAVSGWALLGPLQQAQAQARCRQDLGAAEGLPPLEAGEEAEVGSDGPLRQAAEELASQLVFGPFAGLRLTSVCDAAGRLHPRLLRDELPPLPSRYRTAIADWARQHLAALRGAGAVGVCRIWALGAAVEQIRMSIRAVDEAPETVQGFQRTTFAEISHENFVPGLPGIRFSPLPMPPDLPRDGFRGSNGSAE